MTREEARDAIARALRGIAPEVEIDEIDPDEALGDEIDIDSMDFLNLMVAIHDAVGIEVPERDYPQVSTLGGLTEYLVRHAG